MIIGITRCLSLALLALSLTQKNYQLDNGQPAGDGLPVFFLGWMGLFYGAFGICWLANPACIAALLLMKRYPFWATGISLVALVLALAFLFFGKIVANEGGGYARIVGYKAGYWLWLGSMAVLFSGNLIACFAARKAGV